MSTNKELFITFMKIGGFTLGGGMAMLPVMEKEVVDKNHWLGKPEFLDIVAVSQATPGIFAVDMASHIGYKTNGVKGAIAASIGTILPSLVIILGIAICFTSIKDNYWVEAAFRGLRPAVVALITLPVFTMGRNAGIGKWREGVVWQLALTITAAILIWLLGVSPAWIIIGAALLGVVRAVIKSSKGR
ncbi:MAG: chromate transporter [Bacteroidales bacterium]|nr:chromate transporter [Bacteroidales bacterium]